MSDREMLGLITEYLEAVRSVEELFRKRLGQADPLRAWRTGALPKEGWLDQDRGIRYSFHGVGCLVEFEDMIVDFDFSSGGRVDGFDLWRLREFLQFRRAKYPGLDTEDEQLRAFQTLENSGVIVRSDELPSPHLYRLRAKRGAK